MHFLGKILSSLLLKLSLSALVISSTVLYIASSPALIKDSLTDAGVYQDIVPALFVKIEKDINSSTDQHSTRNQQIPLTPQSESESESESQSPFAAPEVRTVIRSSVNPEVLETEIGGAIESFSMWLKSSERDLTFKMNFEPIRNELTRNLTEYAVTRSQSLPPCTQKNYNNFEDEDILTSSCQPPGLSDAVVQQEINAQLSDIDFVITEKTFQKDGQQSFTDGMSNIKHTYSLLKVVAYGAIVAMIVSIVLFILAHRPLTAALFALGRALLTSGIIILLPTALTYIFLPNLLKSAADQHDALTKIGVSLALSYSVKVLFILFIWGLVLTIVGAMLIFFDRKRDIGSNKVESRVRK